MPAKRQKNTFAAAAPKVGFLNILFAFEIREGNKKTASFGDGFQTINFNITSVSIRVNRQILSFIHLRD